MGYLIVDVAMLALSVAFTVVLFRWLAKDSRRMADERRAMGQDPDDLYLRLIAQRQAAQKRRFRGPMAWYAMWYLKWERKRVERR
jgi:hypothetical protein